MSYCVHLCIFTCILDIQDSLVLATIILSYIYIIRHKNIESIVDIILYYFWIDTTHCITHNLEFNKVIIFIRTSTN